MTNDLMPFTSVAEMRDAVLEAPPPGPEATNWRTKHGSCVVRAIEAIRQGQLLRLRQLRPQRRSFYEIAEQGKRAFAAGLLRLPYPVFAGLTTLVAGGRPVPTIVMAEEVPQAEHGLPTDDPVAVRPRGAADARGRTAKLAFLRISRALFVAADEDDIVGIPVEQPIDEFEIRRSSRGGTIPKSRCRRCS